jgi:hypothetical protein
MSHGMVPHRGLTDAARILPVVQQGREIMHPATHTATRTWPTGVSAGPVAAEAAFIDPIGPLDDESVLVIGNDTVDLVCELIHRGCPRSVAVRPGESTHGEDASLAIVPDCANEAAATRAVEQALRVLSADGRILLRVTHDPDAAIAHAIQALLRRRGFSAIRLRHHGVASIVQAELPLFGPTGRA